MDLLRRATIIGSLLLLAFITTGTHAQTPGELLDEADSQYKKQNYKKAMELLHGLLLGKKPLLQSTKRIVKGRRLLGACYFMLNRTDGAEDQFRALLLKDNCAEFDPLIFPDTMIQLVQQLKVRMIKSKVIKPCEAPPPTGPKVVFVRKVRKNIWLLNLVPFGVGQFQNGHIFKGSMFAVFQAASLGLNIGSYLYVREVLMDSSGRINPTDEGKANAFEVVQYVSLGVFAGLLIWGIIDAIYYYEAETPVHGPKPEKPPKRGRPESRVTLTVTPLIDARPRLRRGSSVSDPDPAPSHLLPRAGWGTTFDVTIRF